MAKDKETKLKGDDLPLWQAIVERGKSNFQDIVDLEDLYTCVNEKETSLLIYQMLLTHRNYVIKYFKEPLRKAITTAKKTSEVFKALIHASKLLPKLKKERLKYKNSHNILDIKHKVLSYEKIGHSWREHGLDRPTDRAEMIEAAFNIWAAENEHDNHYRYKGDVVLEEVIKLILSGEWEPRPEGQPDPRWWVEPEPYGGEHSIIYKLQAHRHEILRLIGEE